MCCNKPTDACQSGCGRRWRWEPTKLCLILFHLATSFYDCCLMVDITPVKILGKVISCLLVVKRKRFDFDSHLFASYGNWWTKFPRNTRQISRLVSLVRHTYLVLSCPAIPILVHSFISFSLRSHLNQLEREWTHLFAKHTIENKYRYVRSLCPLSGIYLSLTNENTPSNHHVILKWIYPPFH